ncbi:MAG: hypothetical protein A3H35_14125 [Betaproteobacteria bacterium RIFCSPLOWO2_02_FULL_62_17]|nr:MAG: hypothetical protein A3H35_14125 [Betaproteobacteria bacterium RIFCSPLOWO2_02_FULL_62_17]
MAEVNSRIFVPADAVPPPAFSVLPPSWRDLASSNVTALKLVANLGRELSQRVRLLNQSLLSN